MLQVGNGGTSGSIQGDVAKDGVLVFHRSDDIAFAGAIGGNGNIRHLGGGKTELTADSSGFGGTTDLEAGTLAVNGALGGAGSGRASCRERVCQYVWISVVDVYLKKKNNKYQNYKFRYNNT